ncbi:MAG: FAD:protein FMN transferase, partial [Acidobacteriaceae bacterium]|nr:FAD:protein FMN transferase [Acidobacteriaceae bacterium]
MKRSVITLLFATALSAVPGPAPKAALIRAEGSVDAMGSTYTVVIYGEQREKLQAIVAQALEEARRLDHLLSNYLPDSEWSEVNRFAAERPVPVSRELFDLLSACLEYSKESEGAFDISVGPLMKVWGFYKGSGHLPHRAEVRGALANVGYQNILLDPKNQTVRFSKPGVELDPGGIGKGYAVDKIVDVIKADGIGSALISAAGSSIYALGAPPGENGWKLAIKEPKHPRETAATVELKDESLSTSGNYEKYFFAEGKLYSHIMDPRSGYPSEGTLSVSVVAPRTIDSEAWAKPYY